MPVLTPWPRRGREAEGNDEGALSTPPLVLWQNDLLSRGERPPFKRRKKGDK